MLANRRTDRLIGRVKVGDGFDHHQQRQQHRRNAGRNEQLQVANAVLDETNDRRADEHGSRQTEGHDDVAGHGERVRDHAQHVGCQDEHEQGEDEGEERAARVAQNVAHHVGDELVGQLADRLQPAGDHLARPHQQDQPQQRQQ